MTGPWVPPQAATESEPEFLRRVLKGIDHWFVGGATGEDPGDPRQLLTSRLAALDHPASHPGTEDAEPDPVVELLATELHRIQHCHAQASVLTHGGFRHDGVRVKAVHRHHTVLHYDNDSFGFLLPLAFIESVQQLPRSISERNLTREQHRTLARTISPGSRIQR
ncbi:hypothetical protein ACQPW1_22945 [Nocardia sp. CA-128927]|uniref:hypothetical protein n=1 Tax=Nocardia sp. CA-128927 TaxID=3239975 RepID=UPI003D973B0D